MLPTIVGAEDGLLHGHIEALGARGRHGDLIDAAPYPVAVALGRGQRRGRGQLHPLVAIGIPQIGPGDIGARDMGLAARIDRLPVMKPPPPIATGRQP